jgi:hypothetical protein
LSRQRYPQIPIQTVQQLGPHFFHHELRPRELPRPVIGIEHALASGPNLQASHACAKNLDNVGGDAPTAFNQEVIYCTSVANRFDLAANRGDMAWTRRNRFLLSAVYDVPVGQNRKFLSHLKRISDLAFGGWAVSTVHLWETGPYLTPTASSSFGPGNLNLSYRGSFQRADCISNGNIANPATASMFNMAAFNPIPARPVGKCAVGILEGPATATIAAGLSKTFHLTERMRMRFESAFTKQICSIMRTLRHRQRT